MLLRFNSRQTKIDKLFENVKFFYLNLQKVCKRGINIKNN